jgi:hypothetical protein
MRRVRLLEGTQHFASQSARRFCLYRKNVERRKDSRAGAQRLTANLFVVATAL